MRALKIGLVLFGLAQALYGFGVLVDNPSDGVSSALEGTTFVLLYFFWFPLTAVGVLLFTGGLAALGWRWLQTCWIAP